MIENAIRNTMETLLASTIATAIIEDSMRKYKNEVIQSLVDDKDAELNDLKKEL